MNKGFLFQIENNRHLSEDNASIYRIVDCHNWLYPDDKYIIDECRIDELTIERLNGMIPCGSVEFANCALNILNKSAMKPVNIPKFLMTENYCGRKITICKDKKEILKLYDLWNVDELFIKSNTGIKTGNTDIYRKKDKFFEDNEYFVSEVVDIRAEFRCFVFRSRLRGMKNYSGDEWCLPDKKFVEDCISKIGGTIPAYTLDVALLENGKTVVMEVHNFVSCGLYGFDDKSILPMLINGWNIEMT